MHSSWLRRRGLAVDAGVKGVDTCGKLAVLSAVFLAKLPQIIAQLAVKLKT